MENNKPSIYGYLKNTLLYISTKFLKSMSCNVMSSTTKSEPSSLPAEDLEGMKEPESDIVSLKIPEDEEDEIILAPVREKKMYTKEEAVITEEPIHIESRI
jgi:hypothetical protein